MSKYLGLLVVALPAKNSKTTFELLYQEFNDKSVSLEAFKEDLIRYMKRKIKKFAIKNNVLSIECYTKLEVNELVKYFKIGTDIKEISLDLLYASWSNPYSVNKNAFVNKLEKYLISKDLSYFIFDGALHMKD